MNLNAAAIKLSLWASQHSAATRLLMSVAPLTLAVATAVVMKKPVIVHHFHIAPACGSGSGGSGGC